VRIPGSWWERLFGRCAGGVGLASHGGGGGGGEKVGELGWACALEEETERCAEG
jgi:hypothetical protein